MKERTVTASKLKAELLRLLDEVASGDTTLVVTKRGRPVARVEPFAPRAALRGTVTYLVDDAALLEPIAIDWDADRP